jgi:hypothetical protein
MNFTTPLNAPFLISPDTFITSLEFWSQPPTVGPKKYIDFCPLNALNRSTYGIWNWTTVRKEVSWKGLVSFPSSLS